MSERPETLWCVHVIGPDDVHAAPDCRTAAAWACMLNEAIADRINPTGAAADDYVLCYANVEPWPWSAEAHAEDLPRATAGMTPRRPVDADTPFRRAFWSLVRAAEAAGNWEINVGPAAVRLASGSTLPWTLTLKRADHVQPADLAREG